MSQSLLRLAASLAAALLLSFTPALVSAQDGAAAGGDPLAQLSPEQRSAVERVSKSFQESQQLSQTGTDAYNAKDYKKAFEDLKKSAEVAEAVTKEPLAELPPEVRDQIHQQGKAFASNSYYNAACCASLGGDYENTVAMMMKSFEHGWMDKDHLLQDADFNPTKTNAADKWGAIMKEMDSRLDAAVDGKVEGKIIAPKSLPAGGPAHTMVVFHGGGGNIEADSAFWEKFAEETGTLVIMTRGSLIQGKGEFSYAQSRPEADLKRVGEWLEKAKAAHPQIDMDNLWVGGWSQGAGMALVQAMRDSKNKWKGALLIGPYVQQEARPQIFRTPAWPVSAYVVLAEKEPEPIAAVSKQVVSRNNGKKLRITSGTVAGAEHELNDAILAEAKKGFEWIKVNTAEQKATAAPAK